MEEEVRRMRGSSSTCDADGEHFDTGALLPFWQVLFGVGGPWARWARPASPPSKKGVGGTSISYGRTSKEMHDGLLVDMKYSLATAPT